MAVPRWAFMLRLMGQGSAEYTEDQRGSTLTFLFTQSPALRARPVMESCTAWTPSGRTQRRKERRLNYSAFNRAASVKSRINVRVLVLIIPVPAEVTPSTKRNHEKTNTY